MRKRRLIVGIILMIFGASAYVIGQNAQIECSMTTGQVEQFSSSKIDQNCTNALYIDLGGLGLGVIGLSFLIGGAVTKRR